MDTRPVRPGRRRIPRTGLNLAGTPIYDELARKYRITPAGPPRELLPPRTRGPFEPALPANANAGDRDEPTRPYPRFPSRALAEL